jgi:hypothetical protein
MSIVASLEQNIPMLNHDRFRTYTFMAFEVFIAALSFVPILLLLYFYRGLLLSKRKLTGPTYLPVYSITTPDDSRLFVPKYLFNFANKWVYLFLASLFAYPLLVCSTISVNSRGGLSRSLKSVGKMRWPSSVKQRFNLLFLSKVFDELNDPRIHTKQHETQSTRNLFRVGSCEFVDRIAPFLL